MIDGYPEEHELDAIRNWPIHSHADAMKLVGYIWELWAYASAGYFQIYDHNDGKAVQMSTAGWSGNESIVEVLPDLFWKLYWWESRRGGHYTFWIPEAEK
jgi:hypothetical protein